MTWDDLQLVFGRYVKTYDDLIGLGPVDHLTIKVGLDAGELEDKSLWGGEEVRFLEKLGRLALDPQANKIEALILAGWPLNDLDSQQMSAETCRKLAIETGSFPALGALYLGDFPPSPEVAPQQWLVGALDLLRALPNLHTLHIRAATIEPPAITHAHLRTLILQSTEDQTLDGLLTSHLPALQTFEIWLGACWHQPHPRLYMLDRLPDLLSGRLFPNLTHLGLCNSEIADRLVSALVGAPIMSQLTTLDLSYGNLSDTGAEALLSCTSATRLERLILSHTGLSDDALRALRSRGWKAIAPSQRRSERGIDLDRIFPPEY